MAVSNRIDLPLSRHQSACRFVLVFLLGLWFAPNARAELLVRDSFTNANGQADDANQGAGWQGSWSSYLKVATGEVGGHAPVQFVQDSVGGEGSFWMTVAANAGHPLGAIRSFAKPVPLQAKHSVYVSFLVYRPAGENGNADESIQVAFRNRADVTNHVPVGFAVGVGSTQGFYVDAPGTKGALKSGPVGALKLGNVYRVVARISLGQTETDNQLALLAIDGGGLPPGDEPDAKSPAWAVATSTGSLPAAVDTVQFSFGSKIAWRVGDFRVGTEWADLTKPLQTALAEPTEPAKAPDQLEAGLPVQAIVTKGHDELTFMEGERWKQGDGFLEATGLPNHLQAGREIGGGNCVVRIRVSTADAKEGAVIGINERSWIAILNGQILLAGDLFLPGKRVPAPGIVLKNDQPFDVMLTRQGKQGVVWVDGKQAYSFAYGRPDFGVVSVRAGRSATRVYDFSIAGELIVPPFEFKHTRALTYGDPQTIAPMLGPCTTYDWDRDGKPDLIFRGDWWRNTGTQVDGRTVFARTADPAIPVPDGRAMFGNVADLNGNGADDIVWGLNKSFALMEDTTTQGTRQFVDRGMLQSVLTQHKVAGADSTPTPVMKDKIDYGDTLLPAETTEAFLPSTWLVDWDGDGLVDLLESSQTLGQDRAVPFDMCDHAWGWKDDTWYFRDMTSQVWFHRNVGTKEKPAFTAGALVRAGTGGRSLSFFDFVAPMAIDWNGDGKIDLLVGTFDHLIVYLNVGPEKGVPVLDNGHELAFDGQAELPVERRNFSPFKDADGLWHIRFDMADSSEATQLNKADPFAFGPWRLTLFQNPDMRIDYFSIPSPVDWDGDGKTDLLVGSQDGYFWYYRNIDPTGGPDHWAAIQRVEADGKPLRIQKTHDLQGPCEEHWGYSMPATVDWDLDGDQDLILGNAGETLLYYENIGTRTEPKLTFRGPLMCDDGNAQKPVDSAWRTRPAVGDMDGDGLPDLVGVDGQGYVCWWRRYRDSAGQLRLAAPQRPVDAAGNAFFVTGIGRLGGRAVLSAVDLNLRGKLDLLCSPAMDPRNRLGYQLFFENAGVQNGKLVLNLKPHEVRLQRTIGQFSHFAMAQPVDFYHNGKWTMLAGTDDGHIFYWPN